MIEKELIVEHEGEKQLARLPGVRPESKLTPKLAEQAALMVLGHRDHVNVIDPETGEGYRLYPRSHRTISQKGEH